MITLQRYDTPRPAGKGAASYRRFEGHLTFFSKKVYIFLAWYQISSYISSVIEDKKNNLYER